MTPTADPPGSGFGVEPDRGPDRAARGPDAEPDGTSPEAAETVTATAPCRVDLAGGTLDIWPLGVLHSGSVTVNVAVDVPMTACLTAASKPHTGAGRAVGREEDAANGGPSPRSWYRVEQGGEVVEAATATELAEHPDAALVGLVLDTLDVPPVTVTLTSASPRGAGLGASSALAVALIAAAEAWTGREASPPARRVALARDVEARLMGLPTGVQDHWPALLGGALALRHAPGGTSVERLDADLDALGDGLVVAYTGVSHFSAGQNWEIVRRRLDGEAEVTALFDGIAEVAAEARDALVAGDLPRLGSLVGREWELRRRLAPGISVPVLEELLEAARGAGAWGGKACGAGGGGCLAVLCPPQRRDAVEEALRTAGGRLVEARPVSGALVTADG